ELQIKHSSDIEIRRSVLYRLIDIILFIGRQGLAYRGTKEAAYTLEIKDLNHGNFLELVLLLSKYDPVLQAHVAESIKRSKQQKSHESKGIRGRGALLTFLSKTFINKLILILSHQIRSRIASEVKHAGLYSIEVDSTQDIAVIEQLALCVRYVHKGQINVKLLKLLQAQKTTGEALYNLLKNELDALGLSTTKIVGGSFDGAANMSGQYKGLRAFLKSDNADLIYVHCEAHV